MGAETVGAETGMGWVYGRPVTGAVLDPSAGALARKSGPFRAPCLQTNLQQTTEKYQYLQPDPALMPHLLWYVICTLS